MAGLAAQEVEQARPAQVALSFLQAHPEQQERLAQPVRQASHGLAGLAAVMERLAILRCQAKGLAEP